MKWREDEVYEIYYSIEPDFSNKKFSVRIFLADKTGVIGSTYPPKQISTFDQINQCHMTEEQMKQLIANDKGYRGPLKGLPIIARLDKDFKTKYTRG